jgi:hypothetical protein
VRPDVSQSYGPSGPVTGTALRFYFYLFDDTEQNAKYTDDTYIPPNFRMTGER